MLLNLTAYLDTPEGIETSERLESLFSKIPLEDKAVPPMLSDPETRALTFIQRELRKGHSPSTREVARAIGRRSSRSGHRVITNLLQKGLIIQNDKKKLTIRDSNTRPRFVKKCQLAESKQ